MIQRNMSVHTCTKENNLTTRILWVPDLVVLLQPKFSNIQDQDFIFPKLALKSD